MKKFDIVTDVKKLKEKCDKVEFPLEENLKKLIFEMVEYLKNSQDEEIANKYNLRPGVGLAANQIGIQKRFLAIYLPMDDKEYVYGLVNPIITSYSLQECFLGNGEGCLSVKKDVPGYVYRYNKITVKAFDVISNKEVVIKARGYLSIVLQHELDHLDGILYTDRINKDNPFIEKEGAIII